MGNFAAAEAALTEAGERLREVQPLDEECQVKLAWSRLCHYRGKLDQARQAAEEALSLVQGRNERLVPDCTVRLAHVLADADDWAAARDLYSQALTKCQERHQAHLAVEAQAGLAGVALAQGGRTEALSRVEAVLDGREERVYEAGFPGVQEPLRVFLVCYRVLRELGDDRAAVLGEAFAEVQRRAATLHEEARRLYLEEVPVNRAIVDARRALRGPR